MLMKYKQEGALLDLGCSSGSFLESLKDDPWTLSGIEMSSGPAQTAEARSGAKVFVGDILDAPFSPGTFDAITCFDVFEHIYEPERVLRKVLEWLKPGGIFYALMPNIECGQVRVFRSYWYGLEMPRHLFHFSPASLRHVASQVGFREVTLVTSPGPLIEYSTRYVFDRLVGRIGISRVPLARAKSPGVPWRVFRKLYRLTLLPLLSAAIGMVGEGEVMEAVFQKGTAPDSDHAAG